jgi:hypothetical protein
VILSHVETRRHVQAWNGEVWRSTVDGAEIGMGIDQLTEGGSGGVGEEEESGVGYT